MILQTWLMILICFWKGVNPIPPSLHRGLKNQNTSNISCPFPGSVKCHLLLHKHAFVPHTHRHTHTHTHTHTLSLFFFSLTNTRTHSYRYIHAHTDTHFHHLSFCLTHTQTSSLHLSPSICGLSTSGNTVPAKQNQLPPSQHTHTHTDPARVSLVQTEVLGRCLNTHTLMNMF